MNRPTWRRGKSGGLEGITTKNDQAVAPIKGVIEFSAAQFNEVASGDLRGGYFTRAVYERVVNSTEPISFNDLRDWVTSFIARELKFPSRSSLLGPERWRQKSFMDFGKLNDNQSVIVDKPPPNLGSNIAADFQTILNHTKARLQFTSAQPSYALGELIRYEVQSPISGSLNLLEFNPDGTLTLLFPNKFSPDNLIEFRGTVQFPNDQYRIRAMEPTGKSKILAIVTKQPINLYTADTLPLDDGFRYAVSPQDYDKLFQALGLIRSSGLTAKALDEDAFYAAEVLDVEVRR